MSPLTLCGGALRCVLGQGQLLYQQMPPAPPSAGKAHYTTPQTQSMSPQVCCCQSWVAAAPSHLPSYTALDCPSLSTLQT